MANYEEPEENERAEEQPRDPVLDQAIERLRAFFSASPERLFYSTQIEVRERFGLKVNSPRDVKEGDMQRLLKWHTKRLEKR